MPLVTEDAQRKNRWFSWRWALLSFPGIALLFLAGVLAWGWYHPVMDFAVGAFHVQFGRTEVGGQRPLPPGWYLEVGSWSVLVLEVLGDDQRHESPYFLAWSFNAQ